MSAIEPIRLRAWTTGEERYVAERYVADGCEAVATALGRSMSAIYQHARKLGLHRPRVGGGAPGKPKWTTTPQIDEAIRRAYQGTPTRGYLDRLAVMIGRPRWWASRRATQLGLSSPRFAPAPWTAAEIRLLADNAALRPNSLVPLLRRHGFRRSAAAIALRLKRSGVDRTDFERVTGRELARLLGVDSKTIGVWIGRGLLRASRAGTDRVAAQGGDFWSIHERDVADFVIDNAAAVDLRKVTDRFWFIDLLSRHGSPARIERGPKWKRIVALAEARPELPSKDIAAIVDSSTNVVAVVLSRHARHLSEVRRQARKAAA